MRRTPSPPASPTLVGREVEVARVDAFVRAVSTGMRALVIRGDIGIGKTALWRHAVASARAAGIDVRQTRPTEDEMALDLVGLVDLLQSPESELEELRSEEDPFARGRRALTELRVIGGRGPALLAIDDVQWLDSVSARTLRYALRRIDAEPIGILVTARRETDPDDPLALAAIVPPERLELLELGPLDLAELRRVLAGTVASISRPLLRRIHAASGGNPLYAIELARGLEGDGRSGRGHVELAFPSSLQEAIAQRLDRLPGDLVPLLETVSVVGGSSVRELQEILPALQLDRLLPLAEAHGLVVIEEDLQVRIAHPLLGSGVSARMAPPARRALHAVLADHAVDPDVRARHLATSIDLPDEDVARFLEEAAERAGRRGATDLAAEFAHHSARLTPPGDHGDARRRAIAEIVHLAAAGEASRALALTDRLVAALPPGPMRAEALIQRFYVGDEDLERSDRLLVQAIEDAGEDELLRGRVLDILGWARGMYRGDLPAGLECARQAAAIADRHEDPELQMLAGGHLAHMEALSGNPRPDRMARAVALTEEIGRPRLGGGPMAWAAKQALWAGDLPRARELLDATLADDERSGHELERPYRLYDLALLECASGRLASAAEVVHAAMESARDAENPDAEGWLFYPLALVDAWLGRRAEARASAEHLLEWGRRRGGRPSVVRAKSVLGLLALSEGDADAAARELTDGALLLKDWGFAHPGAVPIVPDAVEALSASGDVAGAETMLDRLEREATALDLPWAWGALARSRGVWHLAIGEADAAAVFLESATEVFDRLGHAPDAARAMLQRGRALLRAGRRTLAADILEGARARFQSMGAALWQARTEEELDRAAPGRTAGRLTDVERRVAALVSRGLRNREIAAELFMSVASVEAHLTRVYRKLGIRSRAELSGLVAQGSLDLSRPGEDRGGEAEDA